ncbi:MAG TPA: AMP-binding protein [Candidatus Acidoferrales bacterium]|nr:AMP-binding protein [Candidatus Acidoferrales bacterium]
MSLAAKKVADSSWWPIGKIFFRRVEELGERVFVRLQRGERFTDVSWNEFGALVAHVLLGLVTLGLVKGDMVAIIAENRLEWLAADLATLAAGFANVVISPRVSDASLVRILAHSESRCAFVENEALVCRLGPLRSQVPRLEHVIVMEEPETGAPALPFRELLRFGAARPGTSLDRFLDAVGEDDLATVIYTSGSTGEPKGVMRTHKNIIANISSGAPIVLSPPDELVALILSLNHLLGRFGFHKSVATGRTMALLAGSELDVELKAIERLAPTSMSLVPRVLDKLSAAIFASDAGAAWQELEALDQKQASGVLDEAERERYEALRRAVSETVRRALGGRIKYVSYGGAPMPPRLMRLFKLIGVPLLGSYGSTECGGVTLSGLGETRPGNLGKPFANVELRLAEDGEILVRGPTVTPGYFKNPEATAEAFDSEGWFHTGDLGVLEADGSLCMIGRKKDVFYCIDGSNISPSQIELVLESDPFIRQAVLVGDGRPFIAALLVPDRERIEGQLGVTEKSEVERLVWSRVERINQSLDEHEKIRRIVILEDEFPATVRSLTPLAKIKIDRGKVEELYAPAIAQIYGNA